jgi:hypothetical protein
MQECVPVRIGIDDGIFRHAAKRPATGAGGGALCAKVRRESLRRYVPSQSDITARRAEREQLEASIAAAVTAL